MMKRIAGVLLCMLMLLTVTACGEEEPSVKDTIEGNMMTYYEMSDGTWMCDDHIYQYRLEITGRMPNAETDTTFVYLSNMEDISFEQAYKAGGVSSDSNDYFSVDEAVLVDME